jgi:23S rRNA (guanosine2251-2'-O)-methyltransferase
VNAVRELLRSGGPVERLYLGPGAEAAALSDAAFARGIGIVSAERPELERLAGSPHHQGVVAVAPPFNYASLEEVIGAERESVLVLDGVQDPRNLGAILRTARAVGVGAVVLPRDRSVGVTAVAVVASAGLCFGLRVARVPNLVRSLEMLKRAGFWLVGLVARDGEPLTRLRPPTRPALVAGGEGEGLRPLVRRTCDFVVSIPMSTGVDSLNVSVAVGIALYELVTRPRSS